MFHGRQCLDVPGLQVIHRDHSDISTGLPLCAVLVFDLSVYVFLSREVLLTKVRRVPVRLSALGTEMKSNSWYVMPCFVQSEHTILSALKLHCARTGTGMWGIAALLQASAPRIRVFRKIS